MNDVPKRRSKKADAHTSDGQERPNEPQADETEAATEEGTAIAASQLRSLIERIERLNEEKKTIAEDIKEVFAEAKGVGFDTKTMRTIVRLRNMDTAERQEQEALLDLYKAALGMA